MSRKSLCQALKKSHKTFYATRRSKLANFCHNSFSVDLKTNQRNLSKVMCQPSAA